MPGTAAATYDGYLCDASGNVKGTIQVKVGKPNAKTGLAAVKATMIGLDGKKKTLKAAEKSKAKIVADGPTTVTLAGGEACTVVLGAKGMGGTYGAYVIDGSLNVFTSKDAADKAVATAVLGKWQGAVNVAWRPDATERVPPVVVGLGEDVKVGKPGTLKGGAAFRLDSALGDAKYEAYLPDGLAVGGGAKWTLPKAGKV